MTETIDIDGPVTGSGTIDAAVDNQGTITAENGRLVITGAVSDTGALDVGPSGTLELEQGVAATQSVTFDDATGNLVLDDLADFHATVYGFQAGDAITLQGITVGSSTYIDNVLTIYDPSHVVLGTITFADSYVTDINVPPGPPPVLITTPDSPPCFLRGTRIMTEAGEVPVEELRPGDRVALAAGGFRAVTWIGHRRLDTAAHPAPETILPIRILRDAFGPGRPARDLWLSPAHAVFAEGVLIPVDRLLNSATVARDSSVTRPHYFHVELDAHDVIVAEGLNVESYLDTGNRSTFENGDVPMMLHPDLVWPTREAGCAPFHTTGATVARVRQALIDRAAALGFVLVANDERIVLQAGLRTIRPVARTGNDLHFVLPPGARDVRLLSGAAVPAEILADSDDRRRVGVGVTRIVMCGEAGVQEIAVDAPALADGWHDPEGRSPTLWRWTNGDAALPVEGPGVLKIAVMNSPSHWEPAGGEETPFPSRAVGGRSQREA